MSTEQNKALVRSNYESIWNQRDFSLIERNFAEGYVHAESTYPGVATKGTEAWKQLIKGYITAFPDLHFTIDDLVAEGDQVVVRWTARGTHQGELMGIPPTGKQVVVTGISIDRVVAGKVVET